MTEAEEPPIPEERAPEAKVPEPQTPRRFAWVFKLLTWLATAACFYLVYTKVDAAASAEQLTALQYLLRFFGNADWTLWLALMVPYSVFFFLVDAHATWRVIRWYNAPDLRFTSVLPIRASAYILSLVNEQVSKGAMTLYLLRHHKVPGWQALSSMIMLAMVEIYQLLLWSALGVFLYFELVVAASTALRVDQILVSVFIAAAVYLPLHILYFRGYLLSGWRLREMDVLTAFRSAPVLDYVLILLFKAPNLLGAVVVYTVSLSLFNVDVSFGAMLAFLPVIFLAAAMPLPFHAGALVLWMVLFPEYPEIGAFSLVMHTFFVLFNAFIGVLFLPRANRELFDPDTVTGAGPNTDDPV